MTTGPTLPYIFCCYCVQMNVLLNFPVELMDFVTSQKEAYKQFVPRLIALVEVIKVIEWDYDLCNHHLVAHSHSSAGYESNPNPSGHPGNSWPVV